MSNNHKREKSYKYRVKKSSKDSASRKSCLVGGNGSFKKPFKAAGSEAGNKYDERNDEANFNHYYARRHRPKLFGSFDSSNVHLKSYNFGIYGLF